MDNYIQDKVKIRSKRFTPGFEVQSVKLVISSPPYNIGKPYEHGKAIKDYMEFQTKVLSGVGRK